jgi:hypothetical protein
MLTLGSVKVAAAHDQTPKRNQRQKKVESDLSGIWEPLDQLL